MISNFNVQNEQASAFNNVLQNLYKLDESSTKTISKISQHAENMGNIQEKVLYTLNSILEIQEFISCQFNSIHI